MYPEFTTAKRPACEQEYEVKMQPLTLRSAQTTKFQMVVLATSLAIWAADAAPADDSRESFFETRIRPVLIVSCFECHGQGNVESGLRVDSREALLKGGDSGPAVVVGKANSSLLITALQHSADLKMPPRTPLPERKIRDFERWINDGAVWPKFDPVAIRKPRPVATFNAVPPDSPGFKKALQVWFKADGQPWNDGQPVYVWQDSSGRGHDLAATAGARVGGTGQPATFVARSRVTGFPAVRFETSSGLGGNAETAPEIKGDAEFTMMVVARIKRVPDKSEGLIAGFGEPAPPTNPARPLYAILGIRSGDEGRPSFVGGWGNDAAASGPTGVKLVSGSPVIMTMSKSRGPLATTSSFYFNGRTVKLAGHGEKPDFRRRDDLGFFMGHARNWLCGFEGDVAEVVLYNRRLTFAERRNLESHFSSKYRIPLTAQDSVETQLTGDPAFHDRHWAFKPNAKVNAPVSSQLHPVDRFVARAWEERGLKPVKQADARTLVRRLYFDLVGLPPTPTQMENAVDALTPWDDRAWASLIDQLLASPRYGERWGRHWLDVARYADTAGDNADYPIPEARLYRDYVIDSFNSDKPYDLFVREQIAGDLLSIDGPEDGYAEQVSATGFLALSWPSLLSHNDCCDRFAKLLCAR